MTTLYDWLRLLEPEIKQLDAIPLTATPAFPWESLGQRLAEVFKKESITISNSEIQWKAGKDLIEGLGDKPMSFCLSILPLEGHAYWLIPAESLSLLKRLLLLLDDPATDWTDETIEINFCRFLMLETLYQISEIIHLPTLSPLLNETSDLPTEDALCMDITLTIDNHSVVGRLVITPALRKTWVHHIEQSGFKNINKSLAEKIEASLHIEAGKTRLSFKEWKSLKVGDFLLLDKCSLDDTDFNGRVMLTASGYPVFRAKMRSGNIKILEFPFYHEVESSMDNEPENSEEKNDDEILFPEDDELEDEGEDKDEESLNEDLPKEESSEIPQSAEKQPEVPQEKILKPIPPQEIPISVAIEIGRIQISVAKLLELEPGNYLDLEIRPEQGVDLVINGKVVGKGELMKLGETLGVRIIELG